MGTTESGSEYVHEGEESTTLPQPVLVLGRHALYDAETRKIEDFGTGTIWTSEVIRQVSGITPRPEIIGIDGLEGGSFPTNIEMFVPIAESHRWLREGPLRIVGGDISAPWQYDSLESEDEVLKLTRRAIDDVRASLLRQNPLFDPMISPGEHQQLTQEILPDVAAALEDEGQVAGIVALWMCLGAWMIAIKKANELHVTMNSSDVTDTEDAPSLAPGRKITRRAFLKGLGAIALGIAFPELVRSGVKYAHAVVLHLINVTDSPEIVTNAALLAKRLTSREWRNRWIEARNAAMALAVLSEQERLYDLEGKQCPSCIVWGSVHALSRSAFPGHLRGESREEYKKRMLDEYGRFIRDVADGMGTINEGNAENVVFALNSVFGCYTLFEFTQNTSEDRISGSFHQRRGVEEIIRTIVSSKL